MPLPGGAADKWGNRFEGRWTVRQLIEVMTGRAEWLWLEPPGDAGSGCEFVLRRPGWDEHHQVKRQHSDQGRWTIGRLKTKGVLDHLLGKLGADANAHSVFVSMDAVEGLRELSERAEAAEDALVFVNEFVGTSESLKGHYAEFKTKAAIRSDDDAWDRLRRLRMTAISESYLKDSAALILDSLVGGHGDNVLAVLADYLLDRTHQRVLPEEVWAHLDKVGLRRTTWGRDPHLAQNAYEVTQSYLESLDDRGFEGQFVARSEVADVMDILRGGARRVWIKGVAGVGKSEAVKQLVDSIRREPAWPVVALRVDGLVTGTGIQKQLDLLGPPVEMLEHIARERDSTGVLIVDQLDAVSSLSGRRVELFEPMRRLLQRAAHAPHVKVVVVCRTFDLQADERLQGLPHADEDGSVEIGHLECNEVQGVLTDLAPGSPTRSKALVALLSLPLHLRLYLECLTMGDAPTGATTRMHLFDRYWALKKQRVPDWSRIMEAMTRYLDAERRLDCAWRVVEPWPGSQSMVSEHVLVPQGRRVRFFHQTFFDYAWTRSSGVLSTGLLEWLLATQQGLFRRAQLRTAFLFLREEDPDAADALIGSLFNDLRVRHHLKKVIAQTLRALDEPTAAERSAVWDLVESPDDAMRRLGLSIIWNRTSWFRHAASEGKVQEWWTSSRAELAKRVPTLTSLMLGEEPEAVAGVLRAMRSEGTDSAALVESFFRDHFVWSRMCGPVLEQAIDMVNSGVIDDTLASALSEFLSNKKGSSDWFSVVACLAQRLLLLGADPAQMRVNHRGSAAELLKRCDSRPQEGLDALVPVVLTVADAGDEQAGRLAAWTSPFLIEDHVGFMVVTGVRRSLRNAAADAPDRVQALATEFWSREDRTSWLLALTGVSALLAVSEGDDEFLTAMLSEASDRNLLLDGARQLREAALEVVARSGDRLDSDVTREIERQAVENRADPNDRPHGPERAQRLSLATLEALGESRLSDLGRRRLQELRRRFPEAADQAPTPDSPAVDESGNRFQAFAVGSPIPEDDASHMSDDQWLGAMAKYVDDQMTGSPLDAKGGAWQLAGVLGKCAKKDPARFVDLFLRIPEDANPAYRNAIVRACGESELLAPEDLTVVLPAVSLALARDDLLRTGCDVVARRPDWDWPPHVVSRIIEVAQTDPDDGMSMYTAPSNYAGSGEPLTAALNSATGQATVALVNYWAHHAKHIESHVHTVEVLARRSVPIRAYAAVMCRQLRYQCGDDVALPVFLSLCDHPDDKLLGSPYVVEFIYHLRPEHVSDVSPLLGRMCASGEERTARAGAAQVALFVAKGASDPATLETLEQCLKSPNPALRKGVAEVLSTNIGHVAEKLPALWPAWQSWLVALFEDEDEGVRQQATHWVHELSGETVTKHLPLVRAFIEGRAVLDGMRLHSLAKAIREAPGRIHEPVRWLLDRVRAVPEGSDEVVQLEQALMWLGEDLAGLVVRAIEHTEGDSHEWLDDLDWLAMKDARKLDDELTHHDR